MPPSGKMLSRTWVTGPSGVHLAELVDGIGLELLLAAAVLRQNIEAAITACVEVVEAAPRSAAEDREAVGVVALVVGGVDLDAPRACRGRRARR